MTSDNMWDAHHHAQQCANDMLQAYTIKCETGRTSNTYTDGALGHAKKLAAALGYDLVKREPAEEAA
jgi:DhnA family fructose-bisphosphate aldolase class Ia